MKKMVIAVLREYAEAKGIRPKGIVPTEVLFDLVKEHMISSSHIKLTSAVLEELEKDSGFRNALDVYCPKREKGTGFWYKGKRYKF